jgi:RNA polymerase sigma factor (sigma-70 family)
MRGDRITMARSLRDEVSLLGAWESDRERLLAMVRRRIGANLAARVDPQRVLEATFRQAHRAWPKRVPGCDGSTNSPRSLYCWLYGLAREQVVLAVKAAGGTGPAHDPGGEALAPPVATHGPHGALSSRQRSGLVRSALTRLDGPDREVVVLRFVEGFTFSEIGRMLGIPPKAASGRCVRALMKLESLLPGRPTSPDQNHV